MKTNKQKAKDNWNRKYKITLQLQYHKMNFHPVIKFGLLILENFYTNGKVEKKSPLIE